MIDYLITLSMNLFSIRRWNTRPLIEVDSEASNSGFSMHIAILLAFLEEDADYCKIIKRMILKDLPKCILSDISLETKRFIKRESPDLWKKTFCSAVSELLLSVPEEWRNEFEESILNSKDESVEGRIIEFADTYSAYLECEINNRIFPEYFDGTLKELEKEINSFNNLKSIDILKKDENLKKYLLQIRSLVHAIRWNQFNRNVQTSVAGHTFFVTFLAFILLKISETHFENEYDFENTLMKALFHDVAESITGDIISPTKKRIPGFDSIISDVENKMVESTLLKDFDYPFRSEIKDYTLNPFAGKNGKIVRAADLLGSLFECRIEMKIGNSHPGFPRAYDSIMRELKKMNIKEIDYFLKWGIGGVL